ncbi:MAG TPA: hypothetical protein PLO23_10035, partial [Alphaproteobacteria bacterium]|nr:hypothetical protein [Alphaproteobacteria bacterium]
MAKANRCDILGLSQNSFGNTLFRVISKFFTDFMGRPSPQEVRIMAPFIQANPSNPFKKRVLFGGSLVVLLMAGGGLAWAQGGGDNFDLGVPVDGAAAPVDPAAVPAATPAPAVQAVPVD